MLVGSVGKLSAAITVLTLVTSLGLAQDSLQHKELPKLHKVNDHLYRGAQPRAGGIKKLSQLGIKTIINLRGESDDTRAEEAEARAAGLAYLNMPMSVLGRPTDEQVSRVFSVIESRQNWPVFIHCKRGSDRTGAIIAIYRISHDGWTAKQAITEAKRYGMSWIEFGMRDYISDYYRDRRPRPDRTPALNNPASVQARADVFVIPVIWWP